MVYYITANRPARTDVRSCQCWATNRPGLLEDYLTTNRPNQVCAAIGKISRRAPRAHRCAKLSVMSPKQTWAAGGLHHNQPTKSIVEKTAPVAPIMTAAPLCVAIGGNIEARASRAHRGAKLSVLGQRQTWTAGRLPHNQPTKPIVEKSLRRQ